MTARNHLLWVQELLSSRGLTVVVDDCPTIEGYTFTMGARSTRRTLEDLLNTPVYTLADALTQELS